MMYLMLLVLLGFSSANSMNFVDVCKCTPGGQKNQLAFPERFVEDFLEENPGSCLGSCLDCDCSGTNDERTYTFEVKPNPAWHVPDDQQTVYGCVVFDMAQIDVDMWITEFDIQAIANEGIIHHGLLYGIYADTLMTKGTYTPGCTTYPAPHPLAGATNYSSCIEGALSTEHGPAAFSDGDVIPDCFELRDLEPRAQLLFAFQRENPDYTVPEGTGFLVGPSSKYEYLVFQAHYHRPARKGVVDVSGLKLKATTKNPGANLGIMVFGNYPHQQIYVPPHNENFVLRTEIAGVGGWPQLDAGVPNGANSVYPCAQASNGQHVRVGMLEQLMGKSNFWTEILPAGGIYLPANGIHWHKAGKARAFLLNGTHGSASEVVFDHYMQMGHGDHSMKSTRMEDHDGHSGGGNFHEHHPHVRVMVSIGNPYNPATWYADGLGMELSYNNSGHMPLPGGYSTDEEMGLTYAAYYPAPAYDPTIYNFAPCRVCVGKTATLENHPLAGSTAPDYRLQPGAPFQQISETGDSYYCYPNYVQQVYRSSPACDASCPSA